MKFEIVLLASIFLSVASAENAYTEMDKHFIKRASTLYDRLAPVLAPTNIPFANLYKTPLILRDGGILKTSNHQGDSCHVLGQFTFRFDQNSENLLRIRNIALEQYVITNTVKGICPSLSIEDAVTHAKHYLNIIGVPIPAGMILNSVVFGSYFWSVTWNAELNGYAFDDFFESPPGVEILFHECFGFVVFDQTTPWSQPKSLKVSVSREESILKASKAVPLVMKTPQYLQSRLPGFKAKEIKSVELLISVPSWLLDPARANWLPDAPPKETRLCWVIRFATADAIPLRPRNFKPIPPDILIYIDSETGEIVGANFT